MLPSPHTHTSCSWVRRCGWLIGSGKGFFDARPSGVGHILRGRKIGTSARYCPCGHLQGEAQGLRTEWIRNAEKYRDKPRLPQTLTWGWHCPWHLKESAFAFSLFISSSSSPTCPLPPPPPLLPSPVLLNRSTSTRSQGRTVDTIILLHYWLNKSLIC